MDWEMFLGGVMMLFTAVIFRISGQWAYKEPGGYNEIQRRVNWVAVIVFSLGGLFVIFCSLAPKN